MCKKWVVLTNYTINSNRQSNWAYKLKIVIENKKNLNVKSKKSKPYQTNSLYFLGREGNNEIKEIIDHDNQKPSVVNVLNRLPLYASQQSILK